MVKKKKLEFGNYKEASVWFDTSDLADYQDQMVSVDFSFDLRKMPDLVALDREIAKDVRQLARREHIPTRILVNRLLKKSMEGLH